MVLVVALSGCITDEFTKQGESFDNNGIKFQYPDSWHVVKSVAESSVAAVADINDSRISTVIQQVPSEYGNDIQQACSANNINLVKSPNYINIQEVKTTVNGKEVIVHRYLVNEDDGSQKEHVATWIKMSDGKLYVLLFSSPVEFYEEQRSSYDLIVGTFALASDESNDDSIIGVITDRFNKFFSN